jgi:hypothetical protein
MIETTSEPSKPKNYGIYFFLAGLLISCLIALLILYKGGGLSNEKSFEREIGNSLLQIISVAIIGAIIGLLSSEYAHKKEAADKRVNEKLLKLQVETELRKETVRRIHRLYGSIKKARRMLRARAFSEPYYKSEKDDAGIKAQVYDMYIEIIDNSQLELELISKEIELNKNAFDFSKQMTGYFKKMSENVFDKIISEYELNRPKFSGNPETLQIGELKSLKDFLAERRKSLMFENFLCYYKNLIELANNSKAEMLNCK